MPRLLLLLQRKRPSPSPPSHPQYVADCGPPMRAARQRQQLALQVYLRARHRGGWTGTDSDAMLVKAHAGKAGSSKPRRLR